MDAEAKLNFDEAEIKKAIADKIISKFGKMWSISPNDIVFQYDNTGDGPRRLSGAKVIMTSGKGKLT